MADLLSQDSMVCTHDFTYQYYCQHCSMAVGPLVRQLTHSVPLRAASKKENPIREIDIEVLRQFAQLRLTEQLAELYRNSRAHLKGAFPVTVFENRCPVCGKYQNWDTVRGMFRTKKPQNRSEWLLPVVDWRLEQMPLDAQELFHKFRVAEQATAADISEQARYNILKPGMSASLVPAIMGPTAFKAKPFQSKLTGAPDMRDAQKALGYKVGLHLRWITLKDGRVIKIG